MIRSIILLLMSFLMLAGCQRKSSEAEQTYRKNLRVVLDGHDELMKKQSTAIHLLKQIDDLKKETTDTIGLRQAGIHLEVAVDDMFDWMKELTTDFDDFQGNEEKQLSEKEYQEKIKKLKAHEKRLSDLEKQYDDGIAEAKKMVKKAE